jgi:hypothetical protein
MKTNKSSVCIYNKTLKQYSVRGRSVGVTDGMGFMKFAVLIASVGMIWCTDGIL